MTVVVTSPAVRSITFEEKLLLLDEVAGHLRIYDGAAVPLWSAIQTGAVRLDERGGVSIGDVAVSSALFEEWSHLGLVQVDGARVMANGGVCEEAARSDTASPVWASQWYCRFGTMHAHFAVENERGARLIRRLLERFETAPGPTDIAFEVRDTGPFEAAVLCDGVEILRTNDPGLLIGSIYQSLIERVYNQTSWYALIHGGAVEYGGRAIGFPAPSGSGKTTLVASLLASGFEYLSDDTLAITAPDGDVAAWPMPLNVKAGSWKVLEPLFPQLVDLPVFDIKQTTARLLAPHGDEWRQKRVPLTALIFPTYRADSETRLDTLSASDAFLRLVNDRIWLGYPLVEEAVRKFLEWLATVRCYALTYPNSDEAIRAVRSVVTR